MISVELLIQCIVLCGLTIGLYQLTKWNFVRTDLDSLPGPPSKSFITGMLCSDSCK